MRKEIVNPVLSVACLTFDHENYIREALDSFLMQETDFPYEIVIYDGGSHDNNRKIIQEYQEKYPDMIRYIFPAADPGFVKSFYELLMSCSGKYVAVCEGDDYWTDRYKLQRQVDFMEQHPDYSMIFHAINLYDQNSGTISIPKERIGFSGNIPVADLITKGGGYVPTLSMVYRNTALYPFPQWMSETPVGDYPLTLVLASKGNVYHFEDVMGVYRINRKGAWTLSINTSQRMKKIVQETACYMDAFDAWTNYKYTKYIQQKKRINTKNLLKIRIKSVVKGILQKIQLHN